MSPILRQVPIVEEDHPNTAFSSPWGKFHYNCMPFGIKKGPAIFQKLPDRVLASCIEFTRVYIDDIIVFSPDVQSHLWSSQGSLQMTRTVKSDSPFGKTHCTFLGHVVGVGKVAPADCKVMAIRNTPLPKTKKQIRQFLGLAGYYSRFIPHYMDKARLLHQATCMAAPDCVVWC